ncbi:hypothetical protein CSC94_12725 [Zhengella mangrovi]|uniref:Phage neck terminator protein gp12-like domain-containing protein n=2 Tax=Zhengella mangrovi TaxID=1982044 RepID=A0A2G1QLY9_9HYPH|nr:hypothetical protein CSC94_12725 [Zhengella mangrovi]
MVDLTDVAPLRNHETAIDYRGTGTPNDEGENEIGASPVLPTEWRFIVSAYGDQPTDLLRPVRSAHILGQKTETLRPVVIAEIGRVQDVPEWIENEWEQRAVCSIFVHGLIRDEFVIDVIDEQTPEISQAN